jgi:Uncharacterized conserved protein (DUF2190)
MPHIAVWDDSMRASTDMRLKQFAPVKLATTKDFITECAAATDEVFGIQQQRPNVGETGRIAVLGRWTALVDGSGTAIAIGDKLGPNAAGTMLVKKTAAAANVCAKALDVCTISGGKIDVMLFCTPVSGVVTLTS